MRFMTLVKSVEGSGPPTIALMMAIGELGKQSAAAGVLVETGGLLPTATGAVVRLENDAISVVDGPFSESKEVVGGYAIYRTKSKAEAIEWTRRFMELHRIHWPGWTGEVEIRQVMEFTGQP